MTSRNLIAVGGLALVGILLAGQVRQLLADPKVWPPDDFVEYWAVAKLTLAGQNAYDGSLLLPLQQHAGRDTQDPIMMWNPPWSLPAVLPLGLLPAREAQLLWLLVHLGVTWICADRLWLLLGGNPARRWVGWGVTFLFMPTIFALSSGQITMFLLLGVVLFLECERRGWQYLAGASTVLVAIKPHLAYLLWVGIAFNALARGRWRIIVGGAVTGIICALLPMVFNPQVWNQYIDAMTNRTPEQWLMPTIGTVLRMAFGPEYFWLQFVPVTLGLVWFAWYWWKKKSDWNWLEQLPLVLVVAFITAPYGSWPFDMVLLLPAVFRRVIECGALAPRAVAFTAREASAPHSRLVLAGLVAVNLGCLVLNLCQTGSFWFLWVSPAVLLLYVVHTNRACRMNTELAPETVTVPA
ncbi:MAG: DUF2029 domain-containing protein [Planctomycetia bacterium]|nr:DUF2029 domain-containing protein [Planctomycetia bacterium]